MAWCGWCNSIGRPATNTHSPFFVEIAGRKEAHGPPQPLLGWRGIGHWLCAVCSVWHEWKMMRATKFRIDHPDHGVRRTCFAFFDTQHEWCVGCLPSNGRFYAFSTPSIAAGRREKQTNFVTHRSSEQWGRQSSAKTTTEVATHPLA